MSNGKADHIDLLIKTLIHGDSAELKDLRANDLDGKSSSYQVYTFLDLEQKRLEKIQSLFSEKLNKVLRYPQIERLLQDQEEQQEDLLILITEKIRPSESIFNQKMKILWEKVFSETAK